MVDTFRPLALGEAGTASDDGKYAWSWSGRGPVARDLARPARRTPASGSTTCRYGIFSTPATAPRHRRARSATPCSTSAGAHRRRRARDRLAERVPGARAGGLGGAARRTCTRLARPTTRTAPPSSRTCVPLGRRRRCTCRSRSPTTSTSTAREQHAENVGRIFRPGSEPLTAELEAPADRLPRPRRHGRGLGHAGASGRAGQRSRRRTTSRRSARRPAGHRGGARVRRRRAVATRRPGAGRRLRRPRVRRLPAQRLVGARPAGLGVRAARPVPRQVVPDVDLAVGGAAGRAGGGPRARRRRATRSRCPTCATTTSRGGWTSPSRSG